MNILDSLNLYLTDEGKSDLMQKARDVSPSWLDSFFAEPGKKPLNPNTVMLVGGGIGLAVLLIALKKQGKI